MPIKKSIDATSRVVCAFMSLHTDSSVVTDEHLLVYLNSKLKKEGLADVTLSVLNQAS